MKKESDILRDLRNIQYSVPDKDFLWVQPGENYSDHKKKLKKPKDKIDIVSLREKIKIFHESFQGGNRKAGDENKLPQGLMSISEMNEFRGKVAKYAEREKNNPDIQALDGIIKYIDLKNSGLTENKQYSLQSALLKIGRALSNDGGLSIFHTTWFLSVYEDYLAHYKMFHGSEYKDAITYGSPEAKEIARELFRKQHEIHQYTKLIDPEKTEIKQINKISLDNQVKLSLHYHHGCNLVYLQKIFTKCFKNAESQGSSRNSMNEVSLIMIYALLFTRIPMLSKLVDNILKAIPDLGLDTTLCKEKIKIARMFNNFTVFRANHLNDKKKNIQDKLFENGRKIFDYCLSVIRKNNLEQVQLMNEFYYHPFLKQAVILITFKDIFMHNKELYRKMIAHSIKLLEPVKAGKNSLVPSLTKLAGFALYYEQHLENIQAQTFVESAN